MRLGIGKDGPMQCTTGFWWILFTLRFLLSAEPLHTKHWYMTRRFCFQLSTLNPFTWEHPAGLMTENTFEFLCISAMKWSHEENYPPIVPFCQAMRGRRCVPYTCVERFSIPSLHKYVIPDDNNARKLVLKLSTLWYCIFQVGCFNGRQWNSTEHRGRRNPCDTKRWLADGLYPVALIGYRACHFR